MADKETRITFTVDPSGAVAAIRSLSAEEQSLEAKSKALQSQIQNVFNTAKDSKQLVSALNNIAEINVKAGASYEQVAKKVKEVQAAAEATARAQVKAAEDAARAVEKAAQQQASAQEKAAQRAASAQQKQIDKVEQLVAAYLSFQGVRALISGLENAFSSLGEVLDRAFKVENITAGFKTLQGSIGEVAENVLPRLRSATQGLVTDFDLMRAANKAVLVDVDKSTPSYAALIGNVVKLGKAMGTDAADAIDKVTNAISHQRPAQLASLGLIVKASEAQAEYARAHDKTVSSLTTSERRLALYEAVVKEANRAANDLTTQQETAATAFEKLSVTAENQKNAFATGVSSSDSLKDALVGLREILQTIDFQQVGRDVGDLAKNLVNAASGAAVFGSQFVNSIALGARVAAEQKRLQNNSGAFSGFSHNFPEEAATNVAKQIVSEEDGRIVQKQLDDITVKVKTLKSEADFAKARESFALYTAQALKGGVDFTTFKEKFDATQKAIGQAQKTFQDSGKSVIEKTKADKEAADAQEALAKATKSTNQDIEKQAAKVALVAGKDGFPALTSAIKDAIATGKNSTEIANNLKAVNEQFTKQGVSADEVKARVDSAFRGMSKSIKQGESDAQRFQKELAKIGQDLTDETTGKNRIDALKTSIKAVFTDAFNGGDQKAALASLEELRQGFVHNQHDAQLFDAIVKTSFKSVPEEIKKAAKELQGFNDELVKLNGREDPAFVALKDRVLQVQQSLQESKISFDDYVAQLDKLRAAYLAAGGSAKVFGEAVKEDKKTVDASGQSGGLRGLINSVTGSDFKAGSFFGFDLGSSISDATQKQLASGLESSVTSAITSVAQGGDWKAAAQQLGVGIGNAVGNAVAPGLGPIGGLIIGQIAKDLTSSKSADVIRGALTVTLGPTGFLAGTLLEQGKSQGSKDRRALDKYFNDLFDHNHVQAIIDGQMKQIKSLDFVGNQDKSKGIFAGLGDQAKKAFGAVGDAIQLLQGQALDLGVNLDAVLANNLGGSLENLSVLLKQMGKSFEDLGNQIIDSFLKGDLSIEKAYEDLKSLSDLAHGGAFKDLSDAFNTFETGLASGQGSQQLLDSIRAIGSEAETLHIKTLPALADYLKNTLHFDATQVAQFFEAMKASGLNSMEDLVNASNAQLIQFAHNVQAIAAGTPTDSTTPNPTAPANYTPPTNFSPGKFTNTGSKSSGSKSAGTNPLQGLDQLVAATDEYKIVLDSIKAGQLSAAQAGGILKNLYIEGTKVTKELTSAQKAFDDAIKKHVGATELGKLAEALAKAKAASDSFGKFAPDFNLEKLKAINSDVNALGILAKGAGLDFQKLSDNITAAFENGSLSIGDTQKKLDDLTNSLTNGGDKSPFDAFQNFLEGGKNGGAFSVEQFKAIFATASAAGETSLSQVQSQLAAKFDPKQVAKIFTVLGQQGFNTFDDLKNISDTAVVGILGKLDKLGFPLGETSNRVKKILDQMNALPAQRSINIQLDFTSNLDSATKNLLQLAGVKVPGQEASKAVGVGGTRRTTTRTPSRVHHR